MLGSSSVKMLEQVAKRLQRQRDARFRAALGHVLADVDGRLVMWELIGRTGVYRSIWRQLRDGEWCCIHP